LQQLSKTLGSFNKSQLSKKDYDLLVCLGFIKSNKSIASAKAFVGGLTKNRVRSDIFKQQDERYQIPTIISQPQADKPTIIEPTVIPQQSDDKSTVEPPIIEP
jgi:hypothetical protein